MTVEQVCWQGLMNEAYAKWQTEDGKKWKYRRFLANLDAAERKAVILGNFNYQVCNGGIQQWVDNGYAVTGPELLDILEDIDTENSRRVARIVRETLPHVDLTCTENRGFGQNYWSSDEEWVDDMPPDWWQEIDKLTDEYYEFYEEFVPEVEEYLARLTA